MSITLKNILTLPSLRRANVLAGRDGLDHIVTSVSVLEYATPNAVQKNFLDHIEFTGGEIVITAFANIANDVTAQCENIKLLHLAGEVGMILYYVGILMPRVDPKLIELANELSFPLICMPENEPSLRYGEVISEVMEAVTRDQIGSTTFAIDLLEQISQTAAHNRTIDNVLRVVSDKLRVSLILTDANHNILNEVAWPRNQAIPVERWLHTLEQSLSEYPAQVNCDPVVWGYREELHFNLNRRMLLFSFSEGREIEASLWKQALDGLKVAFNLWGENHDSIDLSELLKAIFQDEPVKMRRLGKLYHIDVAALSDTWILHNMTKGDITSYVPNIREFSEQFANIDICEPYEENIVIFPTGLPGLQESDAWANALVDFCDSHHIPVALTRCTALKHTSDVRKAYLDNQTYIRDAKKIFPERRFFTLQEIEFAKQCRIIAEKSEESLNSLLEMLQPMRTWRDGEDVIKTLSTYLLDENSSVTETAARLFVHKNTIKYRLQKAGDCLGFHIGAVPHSQKLMVCLAICRLLPNKTV